MCAIITQFNLIFHINLFHSIGYILEATEIVGESEGCVSS